MNKWMIGLTIGILDFMLIILLSLIIHSKIETDFIGMWGLLTGFMMLIGALPLHKIVYFGGRGIIGSQSPGIPPDEHLHIKIQNQYEKENSKDTKKNNIQDTMILAGILTMITSLFFLI